MSLIVCSRGDSHANPVWSILSRLATGSFESYNPLIIQGIKRMHEACRIAMCRKPDRTSPTSPDLGQSVYAFSTLHSCANTDAALTPLSSRNEDASGRVHEETAQPGSGI